MTYKDDLALVLQKVKSRTELADGEVKMSDSVAVESCIRFRYYFQHLGREACVEAYAPHMHNSGLSADQTAEMLGDALVVASGAFIEQHTTEG